MFPVFVRSALTVLDQKFPILYKWWLIRTIKWLRRESYKQALLCRLWKQILWLPLMKQWEGRTVFCLQYLGMWLWLMRENVWDQPLQKLLLVSRILNANTESWCPKANCQQWVLAFNTTSKLKLFHKLSLLIRFTDLLDSWLAASFFLYTVPFKWGSCSASYLKW